MCTVCVICYMCELITIAKLLSDSTTKLKSCLSNSVNSCKLPSHVVAILCSLFVQFVNITRALYNVFGELHSNKIKNNNLLFWYHLLQLPILCYLADVKFTRYRTLIFSLFILLTSGVTGLLLTAINATIDAMFYSNVFYAIQYIWRTSFH